MSSACPSVRLSQGIMILVMAAAAGLLIALVICSVFDVSKQCASVVGAICAAASLLSLLPLREITHQRVIAAYAISTTIRVSIISIGAVALVSVKLFEKQMLAGWMIYWYLAFLVVEVSWLKISLSPRKLSGKLAGGQTSC